MTPKQKGVLDALVWHLTKLPWQCYALSGAKYLMPGLLWEDGITTFLELTAKYKVGIIFTIVTVSLQEKKFA